MAILAADKIIKMNGVNVHQYFLTTHNPNRIDMPGKRTAKNIGVTLHNTDRISTAANTTPAEQYTRATVNGNMGTVRVHFMLTMWGHGRICPLTTRPGTQGKRERQTHTAVLPEICKPYPSNVL